jgi:hypothetical protein
MNAGINNVIYMELHSGPKMANGTCGKTIVAGTTDRGSTVVLKLSTSKLRQTIHNMVTWARAKFSWSSFREVAGKKTMLSIVWMSSSCTTHLISKAANNLSEPT